MGDLKLHDGVTGVSKTASPSEPRQKLRTYTQPRLRARNFCRYDSHTKTKNVLGSWNVGNVGLKQTQISQIQKPKKLVKVLTKAWQFG